MSFYQYAKARLGEKIDPQNAVIPLYKIENAVGMLFRDWLKETGADDWDEFAAAAEIESVARRLAGRDSYRGD